MVTVEAPPRGCEHCGKTGKACKCIFLLPGPQTDFVLSTAPHDGLFAGRRSGKTVAGVVKAFNYIFAHPGANGLITAPDIPQFRRSVYQVILKLFGHLQGTVWEWKEAQLLIHFLQPEQEGSVIYVRPGNESSGYRGMDLAFFYMDEVAVDYQHETFLVLSPSLTQEGYPHQGWVTSTPDWRKPWLRKIWVEHTHPTTGDPMDPAEFSVFHANMEDNWHLPKGFVEKQKRLYGDTRWAAQELRGEFIIVEGAAFPMFNYDVHVNDPPAGTEFKQTLAGLDFGITSPTSMHEYRLDRSNKVWVTREFYKRNADEYDWVRTAVDWGVKRIVCDPSISEDALSKYRRMYRLPLNRARFKEFRPRIEAWLRRLAVREDGKPQMYISPSCPNLIDELSNAAYDRPRGQEYDVDRFISGTQDHAIDDGGYALMDIDFPQPDFSYRPNI
ncbi:hypothetical protein LCGC14_2238270, partial [marine sediment metagenome]